MTHRTIIIGSPRENGRSASLANQIFDACIEDCPDDSVSVASVSGLDIKACIGCNRCEKPEGDGRGNHVSDMDSTCGSAASCENAPGVLGDEDDPLRMNPLVAASDARLHRCFIEDDMSDVRSHIDAADELIVVCPVYFAGAPSQMKALMDRLEPYYHSDLWKRSKARRPLVLHVVGEGGDPNGFEPLIGCVKSAFAVAGFSLERVLDWVGCMDESGEITAEAKEISIDG